MSKVSDYPKMGTLDGTEAILGVQGGAVKLMDPNELADFASLQGAVADRITKAESWQSGFESNVGVTYDGTGTPLKPAGQIINDNFDAIASKIDDPAEQFLSSGQQVLVAVLDANNRTLAAWEADGTLLAKLGIVASVGSPVQVAFDPAKGVTSLSVLGVEMAPEGQTLYGQQVLAAILDANDRTLAAWEADGTLLAKLGIAPTTGSPVQVAFDPAKGVTSLGITGVELATAEQFIGARKVLSALLDTNARAYLAALEDGTTYIPHLQVDSLVNNAAPVVGAAESSSYFFTSETNGGVTQIYRQAKQGGGKTKITSTGNNSAPAVTVDGSAITYVSDRVTPAARYMQPVAGGAEHPLRSTDLLVPLGNSISTLGQGYDTALSNLRPGQAMSVQGVSGQITADMAYRLNAKPVTLTVSGGSIPASGGVTVTGLSTTLFRRTSGTAAVRATIAGVPGVLSWSGGVSTFTRSASGTVVAASGTVTATVTSGFVDGSTDPSSQKELSDILAGTVIFWPAYNDIRYPETQANTLQNIAAIIALLTPLVRRLIVVGDALGKGILTAARFPAGGAPAADDTQSKTWADAYLALNAQLSSTYPSAYFDMYQALLAAGYGSAVTLNGSDYQVISETVFPDGIHPTGTGSPIVAGILNNEINARGW